MYKTTNFNVAVFLLCKKETLTNIDKTDPKKAVFVFEDSDTVRGNVKNFDFAKDYDESVMIDARDWFNNSKRIKEILYNE